MPVERKPNQDMNMSINIKRLHNIVFRIRPAAFLLGMYSVFLAIPLPAKAALEETFLETKHNTR